MDAVTKVKFSKHIYCLANDLMSAFPEEFVGCKTSRAIIPKRKIAQGSYLYAKKADDGWTRADGSSNKYDKLFIALDWIHNNFDYESENQIQLAPDIIDLKDSEKFCDNDGNIIEIEVRGIRKLNGCYFRVKTIADGFGIKRLHSLILNKDSYYVIEEHYKYFYLDKYSGNAKREVKKLYLSYKGLLRVLFGSNKSTVDKFVDWATEILFGIHLGTSEQKYSIVSKIIGVSTETVRQVFSKSATKMPCVYLIHLGTVARLKKSLKLSNDYADDNLVYKWGMTDDLERRMKEHQKSYGLIKNCEMGLTIYATVDPQYMSKAETKVKHFFEGMDAIPAHEKFKELAIVPKKKMTLVKEQYETIASLYMGHVTDLVNKLKDATAENANLADRYDTKVELLKSQHENQLLKLQNENLMLKHKLEMAEAKAKRKK